MIIIVHSDAKSHCLISQCTSSNNHHIVSVELVENENELHIFVNNDGRIKLKHSPGCPLRHIANPNLYTPPPRRMAVCVLVVTKDCRVLLTKRPSYMRSFPSAWVIAGGQVDDGESLRQTGARELHEETGLVVDSAQLSFLCAWESVYPTRINYGEPTRCALVVYCVYHMSEKISTEIELRLCDTELDAACWLSMQQLKCVLSDPVENTQEEVVALHNGDGSVKLSELCGIYPNGVGSGVAEGHHFAIEEFIGRNNTSG